MVFCAFLGPQIGIYKSNKQVLTTSYIPFCALASLQAGARDLPDVCASRMHYYSELHFVDTMSVLMKYFRHGYFRYRYFQFTGQETRDKYTYRYDTRVVYFLIHYKNKNTVKTLILKLRLNQVIEIGSPGQSIQDNGNVPFCIVMLIQLLAFVSPRLFINIWYVKMCVLLTTHIEFSCKKPITNALNKLLFN